MSGWDYVAVGIVVSFFSIFSFVLGASMAGNRD